MNLQLMESNMTTQSNTENKNILFLVTGMTPQIITETVWALACDPENTEQWVPDEIHVISTGDGLNQIRSRLFEDGIFQQFKNDFPQLSHVMFDESCLTVIKNDHGESLFDLKTPQDNEHAANMICDKIRWFTRDDHVALHVSIAGGRKTMGFYAGYALSLYGRAQDRMSHVLVDDKFEKAINFFYPNLDNTHFSKDRENKVIGKSKDAKVWLANIPFIRMRDAILPKHQLNPEHGKKFGDIVTEINKSFESINLTLFVKNNTREIQINDEKRVRLSPQYFAMLHWFADRKINKNIGIDAPKSNKEDIDKKEQKAFFQEWSDEYNQFYGKQKAKDDVVVDKSYFEITKSKLNKSLIDSFGLALTNRIMPIKNSDSNVFEFPEDITVVLIDE